MAYEKTEWENGQGAPINADNLNKIEQGIEDAHLGISEIQDEMSTKVDSDVLDTYVKRGDLVSVYLRPVSTVNVNSPGTGTWTDTSNITIPGNSFFDTGGLTIERIGYRALGIVGTRIYNGETGGKNAGRVIVAWSYISDAGYLYMRLVNTSSSEAIVQIRTRILFEKE